MDILFEDSSIYVVNKPPGLPVDTRNLNEESVLSLLGQKPLYVVHRIDQVVSGIVVVAKSSKAARLFSLMFQDHAIKKSYLAIVKKNVAKEIDILQYKLVRNGKLKKAFVNDKGKPASLEYTKLGAMDHFDCLEVKIKEGRFHMIRCILSYKGMPIKGDIKYGARRKNSDRSIDLHAYKLSFTHPLTKEIHNIIAPLRQNNIWQACSAFLG